MKQISMLLLLTGLFFLLTTCNDESPPDFYFQYTPVLMERTVMENCVGYYAAQPIKETGKIYVKGNYIFLGEKYKGVHVIDNHNPASPAKIGFFRVPGCIDMAIKGNILYVDNAVDLVAITMDTITWANSKVSSRVRNIFPELSPPESDYIPWEFTEEQRPDNTVIVEWKLKN